MTQLTPALSNNDHIYGSIEAVLELVEYGDYQCPYCGRAYPMVKSIQQKLGPNLRFVFRNFPLAKIHPQAISAAVATEAAAMQGKFWEMHDIIFENQNALNADDMFVYAKAIGLDLELFKEDIQRPDLLSKVDRDFESGMRSGVNRTPTFFVNGEKYEGNAEETELLQHLQRRMMEASIL